MLNHLSWEHRGFYNQEPRIGRPKFLFFNKVMHIPGPGKVEMPFRHADICPIVLLFIPDCYNIYRSKDREDI